MSADAILIKKGDFKAETQKPGKLYQLMVKSKRLESIIAELDPGTESKWFKHDGEELHIILEGELEYTVGEKSFILSEGDMLWHVSNEKHKAKNIGHKQVVYITVGTPPTFMFDAL
jgi:quercetin dioxygenase-like cupin family protein